MDYVCFAHGAHARSLERHVPDGYGPRAPYLPLIAELRRAIPEVPVMALGRITDPAEADRLLEAGIADLVALGRALITDPAWLLKSVNGRAHDIRYCVSCNTCWDTITTHHLPVACDNNPRVGAADEVDWQPQKAPGRKRVVVIGAGVAGMETAWIAAARGHDVTVLGASGNIGGKTFLRAQLPGGEALSSIYDYQHARAIKANARFELGVTASVPEILALRPDAVVLACGATMIQPAWLPPDIAAAGTVPDLRSAMALLAGHMQRQPGTAVLYDMDHTEGTYAAAERLRLLFDRVMLITPREFIASDAALVMRQGIVRRMYEQRIERVVLSEPCWSASLEDGVLEYKHLYTGERRTVEDLAFLAYSTPRTPDDALAVPLRAQGLDVHLVGDCVVARDVLAATQGGHALGNRL